MHLEVFFRVMLNGLKHLYWSGAVITPTTREIVEGKAFAGPLEISTDSKKVNQFSIGLVKFKQDYEADFGVKNQTK